MVNPPALILLESLPLPALEGIISSLLLTSPSLTIPFLSEMGSILSEATSRVLYNRLRIVLPALVWGLEGRGEGETKVEWKERRRWQVVLSNPNRYASSVKEISVYPPSNPHASSHGSLAATPVNQGEEDIFLALLQVCASSVERIEWRGVGVWGEGVSQQLLSLPVLQHLSLLPPPLHPSSLSIQYHPSSIPRFHLPHPIPQSLRTLALSRLSPMGAKNFASHITNLPGHSPLDKVSVDSALFDDQLAENLSEAGRGVKEVWIRTTGTKLTDVGLLKLFEGCVDLERLTLSEVQGRFSKSIWTKIDFPETFKHLRVEISDVGPHHSWSLDHLLSIPSVQLSNLQTLSITRSTPPFSLFPVPPLGHEPPPPDDVCVVKPIPEALYEALLAEGTGLRVLELDWWEVSSDQVSKLAKTLTNLEKFKFELDAPFSKLLLLTTPFSSLTRLHTLHVIIQTQHLPLPSAAPTSSSIPPHTPSSSPTISRSSLRSENQQHAVPNNATGNPSPPVSLSDLQSPPGEELHPVLLAKSIDPTIPLLRDVRKFVRRVPRLVELGWVGRGGVGLWLASRDTEQPSSLSESSGSSSTIGRGRRSSSGGGAVVAATGLKGVVDLEFVSFAIKWKDEWAEAAKGFPAWNFEGGGGAVGSPTREMREFGAGGGGGGVGTSPRSSFSTAGGGGQPSMDRDRMGHERQGSIGSTSEKRRGMSMSSNTSSFDGGATSPSAVVEGGGGGTLRLDLGRVDPPKQEPTSTSTDRRRSVVEDPATSNPSEAAAGGGGGTNPVVSPRGSIPAKFLPPPPQPPATRRTASSSAAASALPTVTSSAELERLGLEEEYDPQPSSSSASNKTTPPALLSYRDRAARTSPGPSTSALLDPSQASSSSSSNGNGKKGRSKVVVVPGNPNPTPAQAHAHQQASTSPASRSGGGESIGGGTHSRRASEPPVVKAEAGGAGAGAGGKKVVSPNGWKTTTGQGGSGGGKKSGGVKKKSGSDL